jgi:hypothetical protein
MDLSPHSGHTNTGEDETVGFDQDVLQGPLEEEEQEIEFKEGRPTQENVFCMACSNQFCVFSPYLQRLVSRGTDEKLPFFEFWILE